MVESAKTVGEARATILDRLDDEAGRRFAPVDVDTLEPDYTRPDSDLRTALDECLDMYVAAGGDRFDEEIEVSTTGGSVSLLGEHIRAIKGVLVDPNDDGTLYAIEGGDKMARGPLDDEDRTLKLIVVRQLTLPKNPNPEDLLVGTVNGVARSWGAFDDLVISFAIDKLSSKDNETRDAVGRNISRLVPGVRGHDRTPKVLPWGRSVTRSVVSIHERLKWLWFPQEQRLQLFLGRTTR